MERRRGGLELGSWNACGRVEGDAGKFGNQINSIEQGAGVAALTFQRESGVTNRLHGVRSEG